MRRRGGRAWIGLVGSCLGIGIGIVRMRNCRIPDNCRSLQIERGTAPRTDRRELKRPRFQVCTERGVRAGVDDEGKEWVGGVFVRGRNCRDWLGKERKGKGKVSFTLSGFCSSLEGAGTY